MAPKLNGEHKIILDNIANVRQDLLDAKNLITEHYELTTQLRIDVCKINTTLDGWKEVERNNSLRLDGLQRWMWMGMGGLSLFTLISLLVGIVGQLG